jgi:hypothetical protein
MSTFEIYTFHTNCGWSIPVHVSIKNLPGNSIATVHSIVEFGGCSWFIAYSVQSDDGGIEYFYQLFLDSNTSNEYNLIIDYDSRKAICSFDSTERIVFVNSNNEELRDQNRPVFYEYVINDELKLFLVISRNNIVLFWNNNYSEVIVKTLNFSSFFELCDYDFRRVVIYPTFEFIFENNCKITFCTNPSDSNTYYSAYLDIESFLKSNEVRVVLKKHIFDQPCYSQYNGSQFRQNTDDKIGSFNLKLSHYVNGSKASSDECSEEEEDDEYSEEEDDECSEEEDDD